MNIKHFIGFKYVKWGVGLIGFAAFYYYFCQFFPGLPGYHSFHYTAENYLIEVERINDARLDLSKERSVISSEKDVLHRASHLFLEELIGTLIPYWLGTDYDFYGQTYVPGKGEIACGYFVTTLLEDMGVQLDRNGLAQMASEQMIKELVAPEHIKRYSRQSLKRVLADIEFEGKGVYLIGLDYHTGILINDGNEIYFAHASGRNPWAVIEENAMGSIPLEQSQYRVVGQLTKDAGFLRKWLGR